MEGINNDHLLPNPNAMFIGSLTELSSFPFFKKRSGFEFVRFWIVPFVIQHRPMEYS